MNKIYAIIIVISLLLSFAVGVTPAEAGESPLLFSDDLSLINSADWIYSANAPSFSGGWLNFPATSDLSRITHNMPVDNGVYEFVIKSSAEKPESGKTSFAKCYLRASDNSLTNAYTIQMSIVSTGNYEILFQKKIGSNYTMNRNFIIPAGTINHKQAHTVTFTLDGGSIIAGVAQGSNSVRSVVGMDSSPLAGGKFAVETGVTGLSLQGFKVYTLQAISALKFGGALWDEFSPNVFKYFHIFYKSVPAVTAFCAVPTTTANVSVDDVNRLITVTNGVHTYTIKYIVRSVEIGFDFFDLTGKKITNEAQFPPQNAIDLKLYAKGSSGLSETLSAALAVYDNNNKLFSVATETMVAADSPSWGKTLTAMLPNTDRESYYAKVFLFDGFNTLMPFEKSSMYFNTPSSYYVSAFGSDFNEGSISAPFKTLEKAKQTVGSLISNGKYPKSGVTVYFREGTYNITSQLNFTGMDSGTKTAPVIYKAYDGEKVVFTGGAEVNKQKFAKVTDTNVLERIIDSNAKNNLYYTDLPESGITEYGVISRHGFNLSGTEIKQPPLMLYLNGERQTLSRWPNDGYVSMKSVLVEGPKLADSDFWLKGGTYSYDFEQGNRPALWQNNGDIWAEGIFGKEWEGSYNKVKTIDVANKTITLGYGEVSGLLTNRQLSNYHYYENILEEIDMEGEYYLDRSIGRLYYYPPASFFEENSKLTVTTLTAGCMINLNNSSNIYFEDIYFEMSRGSAFNIGSCENILINHCSFKDFASLCVYVFNNSVNIGFTNNKVYNCGGKAIYIASEAKNQVLGAGNCYVENNDMHDLAFYVTVYNGAVFVTGVGNRVANNKIYNLPHMGITVTGNDHIIENNEIFNVCEVFHDMGAIYFNSGARLQERGTVIRNNYFHNIGKGADQFGIYVDNQTFGVTIEKNLFYMMKNPAIMLNNGSYIKTINNIFVDCDRPYNLQNYPNPAVFLSNWAQTFSNFNNFVGTNYAIRYPELLTFYTSGDNAVPNNNSFEKNLVYNKNINLAFANGYHNDHNNSKSLIAENNYVTKTNPGFADFDNQNFSLLPNSAAYTQISGFDPINLDAMGLKTAAGPRN
ncbi:MAG: right-handed parallel beta-helix repeat-containing protein [Firmicutes bacterium]|nr:right-handed parallel beta-helix repeat-containing protein [Bacillota bacterium]